MKDKFNIINNKNVANENQIINYKTENEILLKNIEQYKDNITILNEEVK